MKAPVFITGLPRTRTAWLANLFTTGQQFCFHELLGRVSNLDEFRERLSGGRGDSDGALLWVYPQLRKLFPESRWLLVLRSPQDSITAMLRAGQDNEWRNIAQDFESNADAWLPIYEHRRAEMASDPLVKAIRFEDLDQFETAYAAWSFLFPDTQLSRDRFNLLNALRVETMPSKGPLGLRPEMNKELSALWQS